MSCGGYTALFLGGSHPRLQDDIITRDIYGYHHSVEDLSQCNSYKSNPIQVKACPGDYYVYRLVKPAVSIPVPTYCAAVSDTPSYDPCINYTSLDDPWRGIHEIGGDNSDRFSNWNGWYRLLYNGMSVRMPESCVNESRCGTDVALWLNGSHPQIKDGIVTRLVCGSDGSDCCYYRSTPIKVKACPGNYYVYEFVKPSFYYAGYCADQNFTLSDECKENFTQNCADTLFDQIKNSINLVLPQNIVELALNQAMNNQTINSDQHVAFGNEVINRTETWVSTLVNPGIDNYSAFSISVIGLDVQVFAVGQTLPMKDIPQSKISTTQKDVNNFQNSKNKNDVAAAKAFLTKTIQLSVNNAQMDIDFIQISNNNNGSAAVAFMSYTNLSSVLKPNLFNPTNNTMKTMMSTVISATLPRTTNKTLTTPVNFTMKHIEGIDPNGVLSCVYWEDTQWDVDGCVLLQTNSSHTVCSCVHLSTFALIMQTKLADNSDPVIDLIGTIAVSIGLVFLSLALLTFFLCRRNPRVTNTAQINLCISLLLAHLLFLLTQKFLSNRPTKQLVCAVMAGILHYFFLSAFVWMFIEAALLFMLMKNLTKIQSNEKAGLWKWLVVIGYAIPLLVVGISAGVVPSGYDGKRCWLNSDFLWGFLGPVSFILAANTVLFICIFIIIISTLTNMKSKSLKIKRPESEHRFIISVALKTLIQFIILGCSWILGFFTQDSKALEIIFLLLNSQQGTFIFLVYCVLNQEIRQVYMKWWRALHPGRIPHTNEYLHSTSSRF
ncbi:adhesion G protein-coupled receptor E3-like isoform X1 [Pygocentrus nattereri]|uniref:adhesion G protein-coupled receptor E3-like isoform X1 n=1 Tax=Pygocentrus nattereri TaxID=42514 RepID=UPI0018911AAB|nr:adhesion G protein-coupled receptor E3-like isoform X1 [Pygocentrus nattereri]